MKIHILIACDRHDEYPVAASLSEARLNAHADTLDAAGDDCMYGYKVVTVPLLWPSWGVETQMGLTVMSGVIFALRHRLSNPGLTETQLLIDAWPVYGAMAALLVGVLFWARRR
jgi:hypothetical protein